MKKTYSITGDLPVPEGALTALGSGACRTLLPAERPAEVFAHRDVQAMDSAAA